MGSIKALFCKYRGFNSTGYALDMQLWQDFVHLTAGSGGDTALKCIYIFKFIFEKVTKGEENYKGFIAFMVICTMHRVQSRAGHHHLLQESASCIFQDVESSASQVIGCL